MNNDTNCYKKFDGLPPDFKTKFDKAYEAFWKRRNMEPPVGDWKAYYDKTFNKKKTR